MVIPKPTRATRRCTILVGHLYAASGCVSPGNVPHGVAQERMAGFHSQPNAEPLRCLCPRLAITPPVDRSLAKTGNYRSARVPPPAEPRRSKITAHTSTITIQSAVQRSLVSLALHPLPHSSCGKNQSPERVGFTGPGHHHDQPSQRMQYPDGPRLRRRRSEISIIAARAIADLSV